MTLIHSIILSLAIYSCLFTITKADQKTNSQLQKKPYQTKHIHGFFSMEKIVLLPTKANVPQLKRVFFKNNKASNETPKTIFIETTSELPFFKPSSVYELSIETFPQDNISLDESALEAAQILVHIQKNIGKSSIWLLSHKRKHIDLNGVSYMKMHNSEFTVF